MEHLAYEGMPEFRDPDGSVWKWDPSSQSYVKAAPYEGPDRGHATGGDNDLFDPFQHTEKSSVPELEGYMAHTLETDTARFSPGDNVHFYDGSGIIVGEPVDGQEGKEYYVDAHDENGPRGIERWAESLLHRPPSYDQPSESTMEDWLGIPPSGEDYYRTAAEWAPRGQVICPNCREATTEQVCPSCQKDLTPEWNHEHQDNEFQDVMPQHSDASEFQSWPLREPKRNRQKTDDSYPSMTLSKTWELHHRLASIKTADEWDDLFSGETAGKVEIGKWLLDKQGQLHIDHGMHSLHENIAARDGINYPNDVGALGSVYNDGTADVQRVFPGFQFNQQNVQAQIEQAFGPVQLQAPVGQAGAQQKGVAFAPFEIRSGQWLIPPIHASQPITGVAWVKERAEGQSYVPNMILLAEHLQPEDLELWIKGVTAIVTATGGLTSHAAYLASTEGIPVIVGIGEAYNKIETGNYLKIEPQTQTITVMPGATGAMTSDEKRQVSDAIMQYQRQRGGSLTPKPEYFAHIDEELAWREANTPNLESCPECYQPMIDQGNESVCHGCGHKQPIIHHQAGALALAPELMGGLEAGGGAGLAGGSAGSGISGIGGLMQKALNGAAFRGGENTVGGGHGAPGASGEAAPLDTGSEYAGTISKTAGVLDLLTSIMRVLEKTPEAFVDPKNPLSYADDLAGAAAGGAGVFGQGGGAAPAATPGTYAKTGKDDTFGEDETGWATKNRGDNSDPDQQSSSGADTKERGDAPEQLKDADGTGAPLGSDVEDALENQGDPALQEKALKAFHMNMPLVIEFAQSDEPGADNPILRAIDELLEEAFPGYKDGHDQENATDEHPSEEHEDSDGSDDKKPESKESSVWDWPDPSWSELYPHEAGATGGMPGGMPLPPSTMGAPAAQGIGTTPTVCPLCGQVHAPGTPCPTNAVTAPAATGAPITPPAPNTVVTKWQVVTVGESDFDKAVAQLPEVTSEENPDAENMFDPEFAFFAAAEEGEHHHHHEVEHEHHHDGPINAGNDLSEASTPWVDQSGAPLQEGADYELASSDYAIPDRVTIERVLPDKLVFTIHSGDVDYTDEITSEELQTEGYTFNPVSADDSQVDSIDGFSPAENPTRPGQDSGAQVDDLNSPTTVVSALDEYTGSFKGDAPDDRSWLLENAGSSVDMDPTLMAKFAAKDFSPREQREFIDESGEARNLDRLDLSGTHYITDELDNAFNW